MSTTPKSSKATESNQPKRIWQPECLQVMKEHGFGPEDMLTESEDSDEEEKPNSKLFPEV